MKLKRQLLDRLDALYSFPLPQGLVERELQAISRQLGAEAAARGDVDGDHSQAGAEGSMEEAGPAAVAGAGDEPGHVHGPGCGHDQAHADGHHHDHDDDHGDDQAEAAVSEADRAEYGRLAERRVRLGLVLAEIGRRNNLQVTPDELAKAMIAEARRFPGQEKQVVEFLRNSPEAKEALAAPILEEKVVDFILEMAKVHERAVTAEALLQADAEETTSPAGEGQAAEKT
jgi:trigger factor